MSFGASAPPTVLEGDYSDWTIYDSFDDSELSYGDWRNMALFNKEETEALLVDMNVCKKYVIATKTLGSSLFAPGLTGVAGLGATFYSVLGSYVVLFDEDYDNLYIFKDGVVVKTMSYTDLGLNLHTIKSVSISPSGKYVAVMGKRSATGNRGWVVLVGS